MMKCPYRFGMEPEGRCIQEECEAYGYVMRTDTTNPFKMFSDKHWKKYPYCRMLGKVITVGGKLR